MRRILIIDDDTEMLETTSMVLELGGYSVSCANNGPDGLQYVSEIPDLALILIDVRMDGMDGIEVLSRLKQRRRDLPAVMMSAYARDSVELDAYRRGAYTLVRKPFAPDQMLDLVDRAARRPSVMIMVGSAYGRGQELQAALIEAGQPVVLAQSEEEALAATGPKFSDVAVLTTVVSENLLHSLRLGNPDFRFLYATPTPPPALTFSTAAQPIFVEWNPALTSNEIVRAVGKLRGLGVSEPVR
jgi:CheY-like chemotaxis protein